jgi:hypothetical protein
VSELLWTFYFDSVVAGRSVAKWRKVGAIAWALRDEEAERTGGKTKSVIGSVTNKAGYEGPEGE